MPYFQDHDRSAAIGARICLARVLARMPLVDLADALGMSFQQVQKYERGTSRLPAIMLEKLGRVLDRPALFFIETDHTAVARAALLELPVRGTMRRQFDRALDTLKRIDLQPAPVGAARDGGRHAIQA